MSDSPVEPTERRSPARAKAKGVPRVLVVDDEADLRELLEITLVGMGLDVDCAANLADASRLLADHDYALCLTDMRLPDGDGIELIATINREFPQTPVAMITAFGSAETAVAALKAGAFDYLTKPVALESLRTLVRLALQLPDAADSAEATQPGAAAGGTGGLLGVSPAIDEVRAAIVRLARSMAPVAITGESGSGKELAARLIHRSGPRARQPFIAVNCGAIPETLMESEFFGHRKGAFTGADQERDGFFQAAHGGTLFLDEVADLPLAMQVKLLRAIQEKRVRKVGATTEEPVDVRIISATHQDLARCVAAGRFRQDLYYRLNVIELRVPPLRERIEDIALLADAILVRLAARAGLDAAPRLASITLKYLESYSFPGNIRELENILERALAFSNGQMIFVEDLGLRPIIADAAANERDGADVATAAGAGEHGFGFESARGRPPVGQGAAAASAAASSPTGSGPAPGPMGSGPVGSLPRVSTGSAVMRIPMSPEGIPESLPDYLDQVERDAIAKALEKTRYNRTAAAKLLGITFRALRYRMQRLGIN